MVPHLPKGVIGHFCDLEGRRKHFIKAPYYVTLCFPVALGARQTESCPISPFSLSLSLGYTALCICALKNHKPSYSFCTSLWGLFASGIPGSDVISLISLAAEGSLLWSCPPEMVRRLAFRGLKSITKRGGGTTSFS